MNEQSTIIDKEMHQKLFSLKIGVWQTMDDGKIIYYIKGERLDEKFQCVENFIDRVRSIID